MLLFQIFEQTGNLLNYISILIIINFLLKYKGKRMVLGFVVSFIYLYGVRTIIKDLSSQGNPAYLYFFSINLLIIIFIMYNGTWLKKIMTFAVVYFIMAFSEGLAYLSGLFVSHLKYNFAQMGLMELLNYNMQENVYFHNMLINISLLIPWIIMSILYVIWRKFFDKNWINENWWLVVTPIYQLVLILAFYTFTDSISEIGVFVSFLMVLFSIVINIAIAYFIHGMYHKSSIEKELDTLHKQRQTELRYYELATDNIEQMRKVRHDFGNQLQVIYQLLEDGDAGGDVRKLLDESYENLHKNVLKRYCENSVINAILVTKIKSANEKNIEIDCECTLPEEINIELLDLCSLFGNLLDNAIEAVEKIESDSGKNRHIRFRSGLKAGFLLINISNPYITPPIIEKGRFVTSKRNKENHGYGIKLIEQIAAKYQGEVKIDTDNGLFTVAVTMETNFN